MEKLIKEVIAEIKANPHKYPSNARRMVARLERLEKALKEIIEVGERDSNFPQDGRMYDIAKAALAP